MCTILKVHITMITGVELNHNPTVSILLVLLRLLLVNSLYKDDLYYCVDITANEVQPPFIS